MRDLLATPSIIGLGFASREEGIANLEGDVSDACPSKPELRIRVMSHATHANVELAGGDGGVKHLRIPQKHSAVRASGGHCFLLLEEHRVRNEPHRARSFLFGCVDHRRLVHIRKTSGKREVRVISRSSNDKLEQETTKHCRR